VSAGTHQFENIVGPPFLAERNLCFSSIGFVKGQRSDSVLGSRETERICLRKFLSLRERPEALSVIEVSSASEASVSGFCRPAADIGSPLSPCLLAKSKDTHPIHLHLVRFQILDRRLIDVSALIYDKKLIYKSDPVPPEPNEMGWKDTVRTTPGAATRIIVKFEGYTGRYVWHCHILEHEDNEMMRPYEVVAQTSGSTQ